MDQGLQKVAWEGHDTGQETPLTFVYAFSCFCLWIEKSNPSDLLLCLSCCSFPSCLEKDTTFEFERKRNRPERYDRNLAENTLKAIKKIDKVRSDRAANHIEKRFYIHLIITFTRQHYQMYFFFNLQILIEFFGRLKVRKGKERREAQKELEQSIHLVKAPQVLRQDQSLTLPKIKVEVSQPKSEKNQAMEE